MKEIISPFRSKQKLLQMGICALIFIGMAVPFKVMVLIEGFTEVRPVNAVPIIAGLLFGPAGAWGCAIGNLIADLFGTFSKASVLGFVGNFIAAYLPYKLWYGFDTKETPNVKKFRNILKYIIIAASASAATALLIACGLDILFNMWMPQVFWIILLNDLGFPVLLGMPVLIVLTSEGNKIEYAMPWNMQGADILDNVHECETQALPDRMPLSMKKVILAFFLVIEAFMIIMIMLGIQLSASSLMLIPGGAFIICLLALVVMD